MSATGHGLLGRVSRLGLALLVATMALTGVAYYLYRKGVPGTPRVGHQFAAGGSALELSGIAALVPPGTTTAIHVTYRFGPSHDDGRDVQLFLHVLAPTDIFYGGILLSGDAVAKKVTPIDFYRKNIRIIRTATTYVDTPVPQLEHVYDYQLTLFQIPATQMTRRADGLYAAMIGLDITMRSPAVARENERFAISTPRLTRSLACKVLANLHSDEVLLGSEIRRPNDLRCAEIRDRKSSEQIVNVELPALAMRVDYFYPQPLEPGRLWWNSVDAIGIQASLVSIADEAKGQQRIFLSGVAAGVAAGFAPLAIEHVLARRTDDTS